MRIKSQKKRTHKQPTKVKQESVEKKLPKYNVVYKEEPTVQIVEEKIEEDLSILLEELNLNEE